MILSRLGSSRSIRFPPCPDASPKPPTQAASDRKVTRRRRQCQNVPTRNPVLRTHGTLPVSCAKSLRQSMSWSEKFCEHDTTRGHVLGRDDSLLHHGEIPLVFGSARCSRGHHRQIRDGLPTS